MIMASERTDRLANLTFVVACLVLVGVAAVRIGLPRERVRAREGFIEVGSADPFGLAAVEGGKRLLCVFVSADCPFCDDGLSFYAKLVSRAAERGARASVVFATIEPLERVRNYLERAGVRKPPVFSVVRPPGIPGTPCIVLLDGRRRVERSWAGRLSARQERDVETLVGTK